MAQVAVTTERWYNVRMDDDYAIKLANSIHVALKELEGTLSKEEKPQIFEPLRKLHELLVEELTHD